MKKIFKYIIISLCAIFVLIVFVAIFTQTRSFKNIVRNQLVHQANQNLNGILKIGKINGNLISHFQISQVLFTQDSDTVFYLPRLTVALRPTRLLHKKLILKIVTVDSLHLHIKQLADSSWNLANLIVEHGEQPSKESEATKPFTWKILLNNFRLRDASIHLQPLVNIPAVPETIHHINSHITLSYQNDLLDLVLKDFWLTTHQPDFKIDQLFFQLHMKQQKLIIQNLKIRTPNSQLAGESIIDFNHQPSYSVKLTANPMDFSEVQNFIPGFPIAIAPNMMLSAKYEADSLHFDINMIANRQILNTSGAISSMNSLKKYKITSIFENLAPGKWFSNPDINALLNGQLSLNGIGDKPDSMKLNLTGSFRNCLLFDRKINAINLQSNFVHGDLIAKLGIGTSFGKASLRAQIRDILNSRRFTMGGDVKHINLAKVFFEDSLQSDINLTFLAQGTGFESSNIKGTLNLQLSRSAFANTYIDTLFLNGHMLKTDYFIDTLYAQNDFGQIDLSGGINSNAEVNTRFNARLGDLKGLKSFIKADTIRAKGILSGEAAGKIDSLFLKIAYRLGDLQFNTISSDSISGDIAFLYEGDRFGGQALTKIRDMKLSTMTFDSLTLSTEFEENVIDAMLKFTQQDSIDGNIHVKIIDDNLQRIVIPEITLNFKNHIWQGGNDDMQIILGQDYYGLEKIRLNSGQQFVDIGGVVDFDGKENLKIQLGNIDAELIPIITKQDIKTAGKIDAEINLAGTSENPVIDGNLSIQKGVINNLTFQDFLINFDYNDELFTWGLTLTVNQVNKLTAHGFQPLNLSLSHQGDILYYDRPMEICLKSEGINLDLMQATFDKFINVNGEILCDIKVNNTLNHFHPAGYLRLLNGRIRLPKSGINYKDVQISLSLDSARVVIEKFNVFSNKGMMTAAGFVDIDPTNQQQFVRSIQVNLSTAKFLAVSNKDYEVEIDGDIIFSGDAGKSHLDGLVRVLRSRFYLPALMKSNARDAEMVQPILLKLPEDTSAPKIAKIKGTKTPSSLIENIHGSVKLEIPRNTWIKSPDMNVELSGELILVKQKKAFELFGSISILRGNYNLYGKRFKIQKGNFTFQGGPEYNPEIDLIAKYMFRGSDREKKTLTIHVTEYALTPKINFTLNDTEISEGDAISYLVLGKSLDELTHGQKSDLDKQGGFKYGDAANNILAGIIAGQLSRTLGQKLNLDVIEFKGDENWQQATFLVGKYLTNDLFLSYQREFGTKELNQVVPDEIRLEYEINKHLFLQLIQGSEKVTGIDFILKFEK